MSEKKKLEKRIWSLLCGIFTVIALLYVEPYDGLSRDYRCLHPEEQQTFTVRSDAAFEEEVVFESTHLSAIEIYPVGVSIPAGELSVEIREAAGGKLIFQQVIREKMPGEAWTRLEIGKKVKTEVPYKISWQIKGANSEGIELCSAIGYRESFPMKLKLVLIAGIFIAGCFMTITPLFCFYDSVVQEWKKEKAEKSAEDKRMPGYTVCCLFFIFCVFIFLSCYRQIDRKGNHVDEFLTYTLANNTQYAELPLNQKIEDVQGALQKFLTVNENNKAFNYSNVWENQHGDTHPPFYYVLVHTISSVFYGKFSWWFAYSINLVFGCLLLFYLYKLCRLLTKSEETGLLAAMLFAVNPAFLEMTVFLRMYIMVMFFCLLLLYWVMKNWGRFGIRFLVGNGLIFLGGTLTHYYFIVYAFFVYLMIALYCLFRKEIKELLRFVYSMAVAGGAVVLIFPGIVYHLLKGGRGTENIENFVNASGYGERLQTFWNIMNHDLFAGFLFIFGILALCGFVLCMVRNYREKTGLDIPWKMITIFISGLCYFGIVSKVASYLDKRYMSLIYPEVFLCVWLGCVSLAIYGIRKRQRIAVLIAGCIFLAAEFWGTSRYDWLYSAEIYADIEPGVKQASDNECICYFNDSWEIWPSYQELIQYATVTFVQAGQEAEINAEDYNGEQLVIYMSTSISREQRQEIMQEFGQYEDFSVIHEGYSYCDAYLLD